MDKITNTYTYKFYDCQKDKKEYLKTVIADSPETALYLDGYNNVITKNGETKAIIEQSSGFNEGIIRYILAEEIVCE